MEQTKIYNGNGQPWIRDLPKIVIIMGTNNLPGGDQTLHPIVLEHIKKNTDLEFKKVNLGYEAQPETANQIVRLFLTSNFNTQTQDNSTFKNILFLAFNDMMNRKPWDLLNMPVREVG